MGKRPAHVKAPAYLSKSTPVPQPDPVENKAVSTDKSPTELDPTRYGDWTLKGIAVDF